MLDPRLITLTNHQVPRYTSYPTAPHFTAEVDGATYGRWLEELAGTTAPVSLYLHVPFCRSICFYCGCASKATRRDEPIVAYAERLKREIAMVAARTGRLNVSHIHWGGGTPNLLPPDVLADLMATLRRTFEVAPDAELAIELDPRHLTPDRAKQLADLGMTRASLGIQDFDFRVQEAIGRPQPFAVVEAAVVALHQAGIRQWSADLIYGLPGQTVGSILGTVLLTTRLRPSRIALFGYAHVPWFRQNQRAIDAAKLPDLALRLELAEVARDAIESRGLTPIGIDHFARPDDPMVRAMRKRELRRNFQGYTTDRAGTLIGFGSSSVGLLPRGYVQNSGDATAWRDAIDAGTFATNKGRMLTPVDRLRSEVIAAILCFFEVDLAATAARHGFDTSVFADDVARLAPLQESGFLAIGGGRIEIMHDGPMLARIVASAFDAYLGTSARHSLAV